MAQYRREREWFVVGESATLIMMSALQFICYCHDRLAGGVCGALMFLVRNVRWWVGVVTSMGDKLLWERRFVPAPFKFVRHINNADGWQPVLSERWR